MSHGTKRSPAHLKTQINAERKGAPMASISSQLFKRSATNSFAVVLLKPCFSSSTNVWYKDKGMVGIVETRYKMPTKTFDWRI